MATPFATAYPPLLQAAVNAIEVILTIDWPRISYHRGEILKGLTMCWCRIKDQDQVSKELRKVQESIEGAVRLLTHVLGNDVDVKNEYKVLIDGEMRLRGLLVA